MNDGGPAFPIPGLHHDPGFNGMSLRDYFSAKALQSPVYTTQTMTNVTPAMVAEEAYIYADAMLKERAKS